MACFGQIMLYFVDGGEAFKACRPTVDHRRSFGVQFNIFQDWFPNLFDGIADIAPKSANIKLTLVSRTGHYDLIRSEVRAEQPRSRHVPSNETSTATHDPGMR